MYGNVPPEIMNHMRAQQLRRGELGITPATPRTVERPETNTDRKEKMPIIRAGERLRQLALGAAGLEAPKEQSS